MGRAAGAQRQVNMLTAAVEAPENIVEGAPAPSSSVMDLPPIDPPPPVDAESLAAYLYQHAESARQRNAALEARLRHEEAAEALAKAETEALRAELQQYQDWLAEEIEGGVGFRLSKQLHEERDQTGSLERDVLNLKGHLARLSERMVELRRVVTQETPEQQQTTAAEAALSALERLQRISEGAVQQGRRLQQTDKF